MDEQGNLQLGNIQRKRESLNKTGGINTKKSVFETGGDGEYSGNYMMPETSNMYMNRVESLANHGTVSANNRSLIQNSVDLKRSRTVSGMETNAHVKNESKVTSEERRGIVKARSDLKVFSGDVMQKGVFTPKAKEAGRHFFRQVMEWAGVFDSKDSAFYSEMGINGVLDCLYVDGMSLKNFVKEQYFFKGSNDPASEHEMLENYVALIAARGEHVITLARPKTGPEGAEVEFKNLETDLSEVGPQEAAKANNLKERGNQVRSTLKKRMENELTEQAGNAYRKVNGFDMDGFNRIRSVKEKLIAAGGSDTEDYRNFAKSFDKYNGGLQKLGLKPGRMDINAPVTEELRKRCKDTLLAADRLLKSGQQNDPVTEAVKFAKEELEKDLTLLDRALENKFKDKDSTIGLDELLDSTTDEDKDDDNDNNDDEGDGSSPS